MACYTEATSSTRPVWSRRWWRQLGACQASTCLNRVTASWTCWRLIRYSTATSLKPASVPGEWRVCKGSFAPSRLVQVYVLVDCHLKDNTDVLVRACDFGSGCSHSNPDFHRWFLWVRLSEFTMKTQRVLDKQCHLLYSLCRPSSSLSCDAW